MGKVGNSIDAGGNPLSQEIYLEMLGKMEMEFEENGEPAFTFVNASRHGRSGPQASGEWQNDKSSRRDASN
jgi:hypothetical protein